MIGEILSSNFVILIILPTVIAFTILWLCKYYKVSVIPKSFKKRGKSKKFKLPNLNRKKFGNSDKYEWVIDEEKDEDENGDENGKNIDSNKFSQNMYN